MQEQNSFSKDHSAFLKSFSIDFTKLPETLQTLIKKYEQAVDAFALEDQLTQEIWMPILVQTSAVIAAEIYKVEPPKVDSARIAKQKLLELEAQALELEFIKR